MRLLSATAGTEYDNKRLFNIENLLEGRLHNSNNLSYQYSQLNQSQNIAVEKAINAPNFHIIQGPPEPARRKPLLILQKHF